MCYYCFPNFVVVRLIFSCIFCYTQIERRIDNDTSIPYLAMNYFDCFFSKHSKILEDVKWYIDTVKVRLIAIACLTIPSKMRIKDFTFDHFLITYYKIVNDQLILIELLRHLQQRVLIQLLCIEIEKVFLDAVETEHTCQ
ncbi:uncharacterized protein LOC131635906 [Vicia villosa]|uniref:uncharacterized protein LOC131635906 n=1 Tax=Vicia villosa TaxID=3911 RepID=UPI00273C05EB|nr:uncharacterized protein LOC131635906 [Vicia villosa]XP_058762528.1 uncharacterized protein LOC131635906 [Vicia villosa]